MYDRECARRHVYVCTCARAIAFVMTSIPLKERARASERASERERERERDFVGVRVCFCARLSVCAHLCSCVHNRKPPMQNRTVDPHTDC